MNKRRSTLGARISGRRSGQRFDADNRVTTEALIFLGDLDPEAIGPSIEHATHYEPTPVGDFAPLLAHVPFALERATFVDLGSGMGRGIFLAARYPFKTVVGVEFSRALHEVAKDNLARIDPATLLCRDVRIICADATARRVSLQSVRCDRAHDHTGTFEHFCAAGPRDRLPHADRTSGYRSAPSVSTGRGGAFGRNLSSLQRVSAATNPRARLPPQVATTPGHPKRSRARPGSVEPKIAPA